MLIPLYGGAGCEHLRHPQLLHRGPGHRTAGAQHDLHAPGVTAGAVFRPPIEILGEAEVGAGRARLPKESRAAAGAGGAPEFVRSGQVAGSVKRAASGDTSTPLPSVRAAAISRFARRGSRLLPSRLRIKEALDGQHHEVAEHAVALQADSVERGITHRLEAALVGGAVGDELHLCDGVPRHGSTAGPA